MDCLAELLRVRLKRPMWKNYLIGTARHQGQALHLVKPLTFMNRSGEIFPGLWSQATGGEEGLLVVCDTLDLPPGQCRLKRKGSSAGQKGLSSIIARLGREEFLRMYIGIGRPPEREDVIDYVLREPDSQEGELIEKAIRAAAEGILRLVVEEPEKVMNALNQKRQGS